MEIKEHTAFDDRTLVNMVIEGDSCAFDTLFARHSDTIHSMLLKFTSNSDDVEDLMQEAFMKAFLKIGQYNPQYDFGAWIYTIARNTFVDFSRTQKSNALNPQNISLESSNITQNSAPTPEDYIINAQQRAHQHFPVKSENTLQYPFCPRNGKISHDHQPLTYWQNRYERSTLCRNCNYLYLHL